MSKKTPKKRTRHPQSKEKVKYHPNGEIMSKTPYVNGKKHGKETGWREDGKKEWGKMWKGDKQHGAATGWYKSGSKHWEDIYVDDEPHGIQTAWYESGAKQSAEMWKNGKKHGAATGWREDGSKHWEEFWRQGKIHGMATRWGDSGRKEKETSYANARQFAWIEWDKERTAVRAGFPNPPINITTTARKSKKPHRTPVK